MCMSVIFYDYNSSIFDETQNQILIDVFGYVSGVLVAVTLVPQVYKTLKYKTAKHLSFKFLIISLLASISKIIYGVLINQLPIVITAPIILCETLIIMVAKSIFDTRDKKEEDKKEEDKKEEDKKEEDKKEVEKDMCGDIYNYGYRDEKMMEDLSNSSSSEESV